jgi:phosphoglycerol transferase
MIAASAAWLLLWAGLTLLVASIGIRVFYGRISLDQLLLNLIAVQTDGGGGAGLVWSAVIAIGVLPVAATATLAWWRRRRIRRGLRAGRRESGIRSALGIALSVSIAASGVFGFAATIKLPDYFRSAENTADIGDYYGEPRVVDASGAHNLVLIYLESGEETLEDPSVTEVNPYEGLNAATTDFGRVDALRQYAGGGWTMAGLVSTQCGLPLKGIVAASGSEIIDDLSGGLTSYLPGANCLGDVLEENGYHNVFMGGANAAFAAKGLFLSDHGYGAELDLLHWRELGESDLDMRSDWGLSDERLVARAIEQVDELHESYESTGQLFSLGLLTLDTHEPAHPYDYCPIETDEEMTSIYACSMDQVARLIAHMREAGYLDDTAVVIMGDHLKQTGLASAFHDELSDRDGRTIYNRIWVPGGTPAMRDDLDQLSMYATILEVAGLRLEDGTAGLGVSAFRDRIPPRSALALSSSSYRLLLDSRSDDFYESAWGH